MQVSVLLIIMPWCFLSIPYSHHPCSNWVLCLAPTLMESKQLRIIPDSPYYFACNLSWDFSTYYPRSFLNYHSTPSFQWNCQILSLSFPSSSLWCIFLLVSQWFYFCFCVPLSHITLPINFLLQKPDFILFCLKSFNNSVIVLTYKLVLTLAVVGEDWKK